MNLSTTTQSAATTPPKGIRELLASATRHASESMSRWTRGRVDLALEDVCDVAIEEAASHLDLGPDLVTMVVLGEAQSSGNQLILVFDDVNGRKLAAALTGKEETADGPWTPLEQSALMETGNIFGSSYFGELCRLTDKTLLPTAPFFVQDYGASVLEQVLMVHAATSERVLVSRTRFEFESRRVNWNVVFLADPALRQSWDRMAV